MKIIFFFTFLLSLAKAGLWIGIGTLISKHFDTALSLIVRKPVPEDLIKPERLEVANQVIRWIGIFIIIIGIGLAVSGFVTFIVSFRMPSGNFKFNF
jgi:hypothetical protein